jgi:integrase
MRNRGRRHFGSIETLPSGRYRARYEHEGAWVSAPATFATKADANVWLSGVQTDLARGAWVDPRAGRETLRTYAERWLRGRSDLRPTTRAKYEYLLGHHVYPKLGGYELARLAPADVRGWYHALARRHQATADDAYRVLRAVVNTAVADGQLAKSPCTVKGAGTVRSPERPVASVAEVAAAVEAVPDRYRAAVLLAAWCQLRRGEVLALQRRHVDLLHGTISVEQSWVVPPGEKPVIGPPKTESGRRTLNVPEHVLPALEEHLERFVGPEPTSWLFGTSTGTAVSPRNFQRVWDEVREAIGRPDLHLHDLRHSGLTWSAATGASLAELMHRGGHASPRAALRYQHATEDRDKALADALAQLADAQVMPLVRRASH